MQILICFFFLCAAASSKTNVWKLIGCSKCVTSNSTLIESWQSREISSNDRHRSWRCSLNFGRNQTIITDGCRWNVLYVHIGEFSHFYSYLYVLCSLKAIMKITWNLFRRQVKYKNSGDTRAPIDGANVSNKKA